MSGWKDLGNKIRENWIPHVKVVPHTLNPEWLNTFLLGVSAALSTEFAMAQKATQAANGK